MPTHQITPAQFVRQHCLQMTMTEFAAALGVDKSIVSKYELRGQIPERHHRTVLRLARAKGVTMLTAWFWKVPFDRTVKLINGQ